LRLITNIEKYNLIEISYCLDLSGKVLRDLGRDSGVFFWNTSEVSDKNIERIDLLISEYALETLTEDGLVKYKWLLKKADNAFFVTKIEYANEVKQELIKYFDVEIIWGDDDFPGESTLLICKNKLTT
jgi:hypothetical protein